MKVQWLTILQVRVAADETQPGEEYLTRILSAVVCTLYDLLIHSRQAPGAQDLGDAPGLGGTAPRCERWIAIKYLADAAHAMVLQVLN